MSIKAIIKVIQRNGLLLQCKSLNYFTIDNFLSTGCST